MIYETDLFSFSFVPNWYLQLDALAELALPEPWRFRSGSYSEKNYDTPILERYIQSIFRKQVIDYNAATDKAEQDRIILMRNEYACFHTGLYTKRYKPIYACFGRNKKLDSLLKWCFRGFADENSALLRYISPLPEKPLYSMPLQGIHYVPDWPVRVNVEHILGDPANVARLPTELQSARNLPLLPSVRVAAGLGGSLDVWAGRVRRAPLFWQKAGLEWAWRMLAEPHRLANLPALVRFSRLCRQMSDETDGNLHTEADFHSTILNNCNENDNFTSKPL